MELKAAVEKQDLGSLLLSLINNAPGMVYRGHPDWSLSFIGAEVGPVTGYSAEEFMSGAARWKEIIHPDDLACVKESYRKAVKERSKFLRVEYRIRHKNGSIRWVADRRQLMYDETGSFDYVDGLLLDITERKETDRRLAESEYRFRTIADLAVNGMLTADSKGNIDFFNRAAERLFGYASEEVVGKNVTMLIPERYWNAHKAGLERFLKTGETQVVGRTVVLNALRKDGTEFPIELSLGTWGPREAPFFSAIVRDITERKRAEVALRESEKMFRGIFDAANDGILIPKVSTKKFVEVNDAICEMLGYTREELLRLGVEDIHPAPDLPHIIAEFNRQSRGEIRVAENLPVKRKDGSVFFADISANPVEFGGEQYQVGILRDITNRKRAEEEQQIFVSLVENSSDLIGIASLDGKVFYLNQAGQKLVGLDGLEEVRKTRIRDFALEKHLNPLQEVQVSLSKEGTWKGEARIRHFKTGRPIPIEMHGFVIKDAKTGQPIALANISRDISERKKLEAEMAKTDKLESVGILAGGIAHDFNNLLTAVFGNITLAKLYANRQSEVYKRLEDSEKAAQRARDLTHQLLTFSKGGTPVKKTISLQELVKESVNFVLRGSNVKCEFSFPGDLWPVEADEGQMSQVLNNLIINAAHAMSDGGTLQVYCGNVIVDQSDLPLAKGKYSLVSFMDHGTGIPREHLSKIFDPYFTTKKKGSGLGLSTSYSIVRGHGGHITVESDLGIGTTFTMYLPATEERKQPSYAEEERFVMGKGRILVMDDEEAVREVAQGMLETLGYSVTQAKDGTEAIAIYQGAMTSGKPFDSVLMDLTIPGGIGGQEAVKRLQEIDPNVRAIVCSGYSDDMIMANYNNFGFCAVIPKPYSLKQLSSTISDVLSTPP
jgi:PAS domain S-box-containing protein